LHEGNPVVAPFINSFGLAPQVLISGFLCFVLWWYARRGGATLVLVLASVRWVVVANNAFQLAASNHLIGVVW
jgi:hypothetical protein